MDPKGFAKKIITWFDQHGRHDLPWQQNKTAYRVWVSEIMLQQTQVATVIPYFQRFIMHFPNVATLSQATLDHVLHLWTGLGYYSRARNLHHTAKIIHEKRAGRFPDTLEALESLPGIGRSTAGAILALAFQKKATILDGNVKRVLTRLHGITTPVNEKNTLTQLWMIAEKYTPSARVDDYTQAMMDLGATVCTRTQPRCSVCPIKKTCLAHTLGIEKNIPQSRPRKILPVRQATFLILKNKNSILLEQRQVSGVWKGLWSLPEIAGDPSHDDVLAFCVQHFNCKPGIKKLTPFRHTFSHFHLDISPLLLSTSARTKKIDSTKQIWYNLREPTTVGLPAPVKLLLERLIFEL